nr:hypothetical protein [Tanacetum cinerariifolium]
MQMQESKIDMGKAVDDDLVVTESRDDTNADDADVRPIFDEEPLAE